MKKIIWNYLHWAWPIITLKYWLRRQRIIKGEWIFARIACLGKDVLKILPNDMQTLNVQKGRIDYLIDIIDKPKQKTRTLRVQKYFERQDIIPLMAELETWQWRILKPPKVVLMDSFSELSDQLFFHRRDKWRFCCHYSDINHTNEFENKFACEGLLQIDKIEEYYTKFFSHVRRLYDMVPIIYLCFPVKLDSRDKFKMQHQAIINSIRNVSKHFQPFYVICVDDEIVDWPEEKVPGLERFPYHFNSKTYDAFADKIRTTGLFSCL
jgi:hypothetical protein